MDVDLGPIEDVSEWPRERSDSPVVFEVLLGRLPDEDAHAIVKGQLERFSPERLRDLKRAIDARFEEEEKQA